MTTFLELRVEPREQLALPLRLADGIVSVTRDISASGMYLQILGDHAPTGRLLFEMDLPDVNMKFTAEGEIVRLEHRDGWTGIAVRLISPRLAPLFDTPA